MLTDPIVEAPQSINISEGLLQGSHVVVYHKTIADLAGFFADEDFRKSMDQQQELYRVQAHLPVREGTSGGLFFGTTWIKPGQVGNEYFMTKGHFHAREDRSEYYWCLKGEGVLILMDRQRNCRGEKMFPGSLHYIPPYTAHRVANTGTVELVFGACWPSDAGHNYEEIEKNGFRSRLINVNGKPQLVSQPTIL